MARGRIWPGLGSLFWIALDSAHQRPASARPIARRRRCPLQRSWRVVRRSRRVIWGRWDLALGELADDLAPQGRESDRDQHDQQQRRDQALGSLRRTPPEDQQDEDRPGADCDRRLTVVGSDLRADAPGDLCRTRKRSSEDDDDAVADHSLGDSRQQRSADLPAGGDGRFSGCARRERVRDGVARQAVRDQNQCADEGEREADGAERLTPAVASDVNGEGVEAECNQRQQPDRRLEDVEGLLGRTRARRSA